VYITRRRRRADSDDGQTRRHAALPAGFQTFQNYNLLNSENS